MPFMVLKVILNCRTVRLTVKPSTSGSENLSHSFHKDLSSFSSDLFTKCASVAADHVFDPEIIDRHYRFCLSFAEFFLTSPFNSSAMSKYKYRLVQILRRGTCKESG